ncbi:DUF6853 family protein [Amantichitinum ursilacus]|uniref:Uncharacterized protein n=1 Tax=Amantichitinum ursilacus TaxID=857265 RepID=A0A0N0GNX3_9NEIS|nr:hypothetical protein [Amantichitinum ursilacus]KPC53166.1 hypothetical protein WG78_08750 [Amantichitinum ursilacus]
MTKFNEIKISLAELAESRGISTHELNEEWNINYRVNLDEDFERLTALLSNYMRIHRLALKQNDLLAARSALVNARVIAHSLCSFFEDIKDDLILAAQSGLNRTDNRELDWPPLLDKYDFDEKYRNNQE